MFTTRMFVAIVSLAAGAACSSTPTGPERALAAAGSGLEAKAGAAQQSGTAGTAFVEVAPGVYGFASGVRDGVSGRLVTLTGDISGTNFEPGECIPGVDMSLGFPTSCVTFGEGAGQFRRARTGGTAFTICECVVGGVGNPGDTVVLKITYPPATPPQYPYGFTKFTFQHGTGALAGLRGQGTLNFAQNPAVSFNYHFVGGN